MNSYSNWDNINIPSLFNFLLFIFIKGWRDILSIFFTTDQITKYRCRHTLRELKRKYGDFKSGAQFS